MTRKTLSIVLAGALTAVAVIGCGGASGGGAKTDAAADHPGGSAGSAGGSAGGAGAGGAAGASAGGAAGTSTGSAGAGGAAGAGGRGAGGGAGGSGNRDGGATAGAGGGARDGGCPSQNPDPCICGRPDANSLSAAECVREKSCRDAGGVWEPYLVELPEGGSYGPRCESRDGAPRDSL
jgi:hypothetical protein